MNEYTRHRRKENRCEERKVEYGGPLAQVRRRRSWRCQLVLGHDGPHISFSGHRSWNQSEDRCPSAFEKVACPTCGRFLDIVIPDHRPL